MINKWVPKCWYDWELPKGRTPESFAYKVEEIWSGQTTDTLYTDEEAEVERLVAAMLGGAYHARVTRDGQQTYHQGGDE